MLWHPKYSNGAVIIILLQTAIEFFFSHAHMRRRQFVFFNFTEPRRDRSNSLHLFILFAFQAWPVLVTFVYRRYLTLRASCDNTKLTDGTKNTGPAMVKYYQRCGNQSTGRDYSKGRLRCLLINHYIINTRVGYVLLHSLGGIRSTRVERET
ncbi:hypothetical protein F5Y00DRAFT_231441 [Daldinia vernicosa]|uniref:uncharacterized protein n=1 Tax=Daldinia vernicosa TaxID=114800 RepID=UPI0020073A6D|nr:uncharacterized protein F5Y00DRAFT_231441 [Daldinia vernicosa]KAI0851010.1 hypothetical protein F5Y00DRAFT_231441 [Daldinia vernicosa]